MCTRQQKLPHTSCLSICRNPAAVAPGSPHRCQHLPVTNPDPLLNHRYSNPFPSILLVFNLFFDIKGWRRSFIYCGTLKAAPTEHPELGLWCSCAKAQEENISCFSCNLNQGQLHRLPGEGKTGCWDAQHPSGSVWSLQPSQAPFWGDTVSQVLQEQNSTNALPRTKLV